MPDRRHPESLAVNLNSGLDASRFPGWLVILGALTAIGPLSIDMYLPAFAAIEQDLHAPAGGAELTLAGFFIGMACGQLVWGPLSDRFGRIPPLFAGLTLFAIATLGCALTDNITSLIAWRLMQALGGSAGMVIARAVVRDRCSARESARAFSTLILVMGLAPILAPIIGGWVVSAFNWRAIFFLLFAFALACLLAIRFGLQESHSTRHEPPLNALRIGRDYASLFASRAFLGYTLSGGLAMAGMFAYIAGSPFVLIQLGGIAPKHFGWAFGINALGFIIASQLNARSLKTIAPTAMLRHALWVPALAGLMLAGLTFSGTATLPLTLLCMFLYVASLGFIAPNSSASALATHGQRAGTASALMGALQFGLATLTGVGISRLHDGTAGPLALLLAVCGVGAWLLHRWLVHPHDQHLG
jgi:DHA1 family bicyclomycin/chloramphenicol resistance-like MFS transporter